MNSDFEQKLEVAVLTQADFSDARHDLSHPRRVKKIALEIPEREGRGDREILIAARSADPANFNIGRDIPPYSLIRR